MDQGCPKVQTKVACSARGCHNHDLVKVRCVGCHRLFCVSHRQQLDHECTALPRTTPTATAPAPASGSGKSWSARMQSLMAGVRARFDKSKSVAVRRAVGDERVPVERRWQAEVHFPYTSKVEPLLMFFSDAWSVGKALDAIAERGGITNRNDKVAPGDKLFLWDLSNGEKLSNITVVRTLPRNMVLLLETEAGVRGG